MIALALFSVVWLLLGVPGLRFDFLRQQTGFQIAETIFAVGASDPVWLTLLAGLVNTLRVSLAAIALALPLAILLSLARTAALRPVRWVASAIIEPIRNTPVLLQLFLWYGIVTQTLPGPRQAIEILPGILLCNRGLFLPWFGAGGIDWPKLSGFNIEGGLSVSPELTVLCLGLALFHGCYLAEIFRAGFRAVPHGQRDAAKALSISPLVSFRKIILPQALGFALPSIAVQILGLVKNSSLAVAIGFPDFIAVLNTTVNQNGRALEGLALTICVYLGLNALLGVCIERVGRGLGAKALGELVIERRQVDEAGSGRLGRLELGMALLLVLVAGIPLWNLLHWAVIDAVWSGSPADCIKAGGACWAVVTEKIRLLAFGLFPPGEIWRPALAAMLLVVAVVAVGRDSMRHPKLGIAAIFAAIVIWLWLLGGGVGLVGVPSNAWGGLTLTIGLAVLVVVVANVLAVPVALARRSPRKAVSTPALIFIEIFRSVPLVALLLSADLLIPTLLPAGWQIDKLWRAFTAITMLATVSLAEVLRGALGSVPAGQGQAARALGLSVYQAFFLVTLPQAMRIALPAAINVFVGAIKDTSLVLIVGILDVTGAAKAAVADPAWRAFAPEIYLFLAAVYFNLCFPVARFARRLEAQATAASPSRKRSMSAASL